MSSTSLLAGEHLLTYQALTENGRLQPVTWSAVRALLAQLGEVVVTPDGNLEITRHGHSLVLHPAQTKDAAESGELPALRRFLEQSDTATVPAAGRDPHLLLVINGEQARLFRCQVLGGVPQLVLPYERSKPDPSEHGRQVCRPPAAPSADGFFLPMAEELQVAGQILIFSTDASSRAREFVAWLSQHDSDLSRRIIGVAPIEASHLTEAGLLVVARAFYASRKLPAER
jgi:hypothetical protein